MEVTKLNEFTGHKAAIYSLCASSKAGHFISCGSEGIVAEWNLATGEGKAMAEAPAAVFSVCMIPERDLLLLGLQTGDIVFVDLKNGQAIKRVQLHKRSVFDLLPMPDGEHVLASGEDGAISLWNLDRMDHIHWQQVSPKSVRTLALDREAQILYAGASDSQIRAFDLGLNLQNQWKGHAPSIFRLLMGQEGRLFSTGRDAHIRAWDTRGEGMPIESLSIPAHNYAVNDLIIGPNGWLISGSMDKSIKIWDSETLQLLKVINFEKNQCHWNGVNRLLYLDETLISCSDDRKIMTWKINS
jgi:WD40 repeat protein